MRLTVHRKETFNAAHRLHNPDWSAERNSEVFGLCNLPNFHGHNYELHVDVTGELDERSGMVIDLKVLSDLIRDNVTSQLDHKNLNLDVPDFRDLNPTAENIAVVIYRRLRPKLAKDLDLRVRLYETERNYVSYPA